MRIKELAGLTGVTVRTIRYYHQIGLLPVPAARYGARDYDMVHVARLVRIRWLIQAGVPLARIAGLLGPPLPGAGAASRVSVLADLHATVDALDQQMVELQAQRDRIARLVKGVEDGGQLSPMPAAITRFYDDMAARATDTAVRRVIRRERDFMELAYYRGDMPPEAAVVYEGLTEAGRGESVALFGQIAARLEPDRPPTDAEVEQMAAAVVDRLARFLGPDLPRVYRSIDLAVARRAADLYLRLADGHERDVARRISEALLAAIEKEHLR